MASWTVNYDWASSTTSSTDSTWTVWNVADTTAASTTLTWTTWTSNVSYRAPARRPTAEEQAAIDAGVERFRREEAERLRVEAEADARAEALLLERLDEAQLERYRRERKFVVRAPSGREYLIDASKLTHNVFELQGGRPVAELCVYAAGVPRADSVTTQKLMLETCEEALVAAANWRAVVA